MRRKGPFHVIARLLVPLGIIALLLLPAQTVGAAGSQVGLNPGQRANLMQIAKDTWKFYAQDVDPSTNLPMDNITYAGGSAGPTSYGRYTSAANIGVYLWAVVAANDLGLISNHQASEQISATLTEVAKLKRDHGFLYQWYDTTTGLLIRNPGDPNPCSPTPVQDNCYFISQVDNGWYASGLIVVRSALPNLRRQVDALMAPMDFGLFYDNGPQTHCNVNDAGQPTGQMYGGYFVAQGPAGYHNGAFYSDPRISAYVGMGLHQMPGDVWWRTWRTLPPKAPYSDCQISDPDFSWQGQWPVPGNWTIYRDPQSGKEFNVWEGHYVYPNSSFTFIPTWAGGMFEGLMANEVVPETTWGPRSFGLADARWAQVQIMYETQSLHYPVWGISPSSTADDSGQYMAYGAYGQAYPYAEKKGLSNCYGCANGEDVVTPHASFLALDVAPQQAYANIQALRTLYPGVYGPVGFFDAVNPTTGSVGHRDLVLDQSMIMAALDNALEGREMQQHFARDPASWAAKLYLSTETMSLG
ncbi:MAG TPA: glucoamylase family protein [Candidatus Dormibacteraeota bacterium]